MKKIILILTVLCCTSAKAQNIGYLGITLGPSIPSGDFGSKDPANKSAGLATTGFVIEGTIAFKLGKHIGMSALLRSQNNWPDNLVLEDELETQTGVAWEVETTAWKLGGFMLGPYGSFPVSEKVSFDTRVMIGFLFGNSPELDFTLKGSGGAGWVKQKSTSSEAVLSFLFGCGFKFNVSEKICLLTNLDYLGSEPEFNNVQILSSAGGSPAKTSFTQSYSTVNLMVGFGIRL